ncbi:SGNH/GDSL hydrolase family protein [Zeaxanthinibacter sp. PT1]|uniref:SGNH/GDSL hydrolase family protein n=1 Tax=Zeaxanthinibacter TaxID=561554 RepID=UPI002349F711|nr:SGNH/GDSL hydrolase family protein [Zeaxanthinibacter sp. PT1]MDC6350483.1 SGNH/GDSL hydrolase family protein [Zeaxanthinibacter sp. PT1]
MKSYCPFLILLCFFSCSTPAPTQRASEHGGDRGSDENTTTADIRYLALGDSYTIGESVCDACSFPAQLTEAIKEERNFTALDLKIIARTGWTTTQLLTAIEQEDPDTNYDMVTLLIGVNNQFQGKDFSLYESEFETLLQKAIQFAQGDVANVIVLSIPDYAFTPYGQNTSDPERISTELDAYNAYAAQVAQQYQVTFLNITDITREGLDNPSLVASDGLHPSKEAYGRFVERLLPIALDKIKD